MGSTSKVVSMSALVGGLATMISIAAGSAAAEPQDCVVNQGPTGATAHCGGDGSYILEVDCFGMSLASGQLFGPYFKADTGFADQPGIQAGRECMMPTTLGQIGIATGARITQVPTRPALPNNAYEYDRGRR
ncbi:hypothetical protein [Nocardia concava]|uniref:hypothetical protein n=1 Tax=Nocardia concava TaxID=257281 RepID=UPI0003115F2F|nr:hypothetical protein [Nocardia concava]